MTHFRGSFYPLFYPVLVQSHLEGVGSAGSREFHPGQQGITPYTPLATDIIYFKLYLLNSYEMHIGSHILREGQTSLVFFPFKLIMDAF